MAVAVSANNHNNIIIAESTPKGYATNVNNIIATHARAFEGTGEYEEATSVPINAIIAASNILNDFPPRSEELSSINSCAVKTAAQNPVSCAM